MLGAKMRFNPSPAPADELYTGPFKGMRTTMRGAAEKGFAEWMMNCYSADPLNGGEIIARPGRQLYPTVLAGPNQMGVIDGSPRAIQLFTKYTLLGQIDFLVGIVGGKFYSDRNGAGIAEAVNAATFTAAGITLSAFDEYFAVMFNNKLIVAGPTFAFTWDGTINGGIVKLTNAGAAFYGPPVVYASKVFFIRGTRQTIVWSEEGDETTGYEAGGFANAWDLRQTSSEPLTALMPTNTGLYYLRRGSIGVIYGGEATTFQTSATLDDVSASIGTDSPTSVILAEDTIWFTDQRGRPNCFVVGSKQILPIWIELERLFTPISDDGGGYQFGEPIWEAATLLLYGSNNQAIHFRSLDMVLFSYRYSSSSQQNATAMDVLVGFHTKTKRAQTVWRFPTGPAKLIEVYDGYYGSGEYALVIADLYGFTYALNVAAVAIRNNDAIWWIDRDMRFGDVDVIAGLIGPRHFSSIAQDLRVRRLDLDYIGLRALSTISVWWVTPEINKAGGVRFTADQPLVVSLDGAGRPLPQSPVAIGMNELARWIAFGFSWKAQTTRIRLMGWQVTAYPVGVRPRARVH